MSCSHVYFERLHILEGRGRWRGEWFEASAMAMGRKGLVELYWYRSRLITWALIVKVVHNKLMAVDYVMYMYLRW